LLRWRQSADLLSLRRAICRIAPQRVRESREKQEALVSALQDRLGLAYVRYRGGVDTQINALDADRDLFPGNWTWRRSGFRNAHRRSALQGARRRMANKLKTRSESRQKPAPPLCFVDPRLDEAGGGEVGGLAEKPRFGDILHLMGRVIEQGRCAVQGLRAPNDSIGSLGEAFAGVPNDLGLPSAAGIPGREISRRRLSMGLPNCALLYATTDAVSFRRHSSGDGTDIGVCEGCASGRRESVRGFASGAVWHAEPRSNCASRAGWLSSAGS
jgi:hypothetical protein